MIQAVSNMGNEQTALMPSKYATNSSSSISSEQQKIDEECVTFKIATFNYGYCDSPFQYYD